MKYRILDLSLILAMLLGGIMAWSTARERSRLESEYQRLVRTTGELPIGDPSKLHIRALETGEPLHFAWRIYLPPNYAFQTKELGGFGLGTSTSAQPKEFIARVRIREDEVSRLKIYQHFSGTSSWGSFGDKSLSMFLHACKDKIEVEQLGTDKLVTIEPDGSAVLLRLTIPKELQPEARKTLSPYFLGEHFPVFFEIDFGPKKPKVPTALPGR